VTDSSVPRKGVFCVALGFGALLRERYPVSPTVTTIPHAAHEMGDMFDLGSSIAEGWGGWWRAAALLPGSRSVSPVGDALEFLSVKLHRAVPFLIWSCFSGILPNPLLFPFSVPQ